MSKVSSALLKTEIIRLLKRRFELERIYSNRCVYFGYPLHYKTKSKKVKKSTRPVVYHRISYDKIYAVSPGRYKYITGKKAVADDITEYDRISKQLHSNENDLRVMLQVEILLLCKKMGLKIYGRQFNDQVACFHKILISYTKLRTILVKQGNSAEKHLTTQSYNKLRKAYRRYCITSKNYHMIMNPAVRRISDRLLREKVVKRR